MVVQHRLKVQVFVQCPYAKADHCLAVTAVDHLTGAEHLVTQHQGRPVEDQHIHIVGVQQVHQPADEFQAGLETFIGGRRAAQQHGHVQIAKRTRPAKHLGAKKISHEHLGLPGKIAFQLGSHPTQVKNRHPQLPFASCTILTPALAPMRVAPAATIAFASS